MGGRGLGVSEFPGVFRCRGGGDVVGYGASSLWLCRLILKPFRDAAWCVRGLWG